MCSKNSIANDAQTKLLVATWLNNIFSIGALIGSLVLSGPVFQKSGFNKTCLTIGVAMLAVIILCILCLKRERLFTRLFYNDELVHAHLCSSQSSSPPVTTRQVSASSGSEFCCEEELEVEDEGSSGSLESNNHLTDAVSEVSSLFQDDVTLLRL